MNFRELILKSGDSNLKSYNFSNGILKITAIIGDLNKEYILEFHTDSLEADPIEKFDSINTTFFIELIKLEKKLKIKNGFYIPNDSFHKLMKEAKLSLHLAYGKRTSEVKYLVLLKGYQNLLSFTLKKLNENYIKIYER